GMGRRLRRVVMPLRSVFRAFSLWALVDGNLDALKGKTIAGKIHGQSRCVYLAKIMYCSLGHSVDGKRTEEFYSDLSIVGYITTVRAESSLRFSRLSISLAGLEDWRRCCRMDQSSSEPAQYRNMYRS